MCGDHQRPQTLAEMCRNMGIYYGFRSVAVRVKYPGFMLLDPEDHISMTFYLKLSSFIQENAFKNVVCCHPDLHELT